MPLNADHFIVLVTDMDAAVEDYRALGFAVQERADSASHGAAYRFIVLEDGSYILLTSFTDAATLAKHRLAPVLREGEGWGDYSFTVDDVAAATEALSRIGSPVAGPVEVANTLADGSKWGLKLLMTGRGAGGDDALPFVVEDVLGRNHRIPGFQPHANGITSVEKIRIASATPEATAGALSIITGVEAKEDGKVVSLATDTASIEVFEDSGAERIGRATGGLHELVLRGPAPVALMDLDRTHGARISVVGR